MAQQERFTLERARLLMPEVRKFTNAAVRAIERIQEDLASSEGTTPDELAAAEREMQQIVQGWAGQIQALGAEAKGLWLVDFDNGAGYFCWQHPEADLTHYHDYEAGFAGRTPIQ